MITVIIILSVITLLMVVAAIIGTKMSIERTTTINKPLEEVFKYVRFTKNHDNFSVWNMMDPDMKKEYRGSDGSVGFVYIWDSNKDKNVGAGEQEIKGINEGHSIEYELRFSRPMQSIATSKFIFNSISPNQTEVKWGFYSEMKFLMNIMKPMLQNMLGKQLEQGLFNLKRVLENNKS